MNANQPHPFSASVTGLTCGETKYPEYQPCGMEPSDPIHTGTRPAPPELEYPYPPCSMCGETTDYEDGFRCYPCGAHWGESGPGGWDDPSLPVCTSTHKPFDRPGFEAKYEHLRHHVSHCIREEEHGGKHRAGEFDEWEDQ